MAKAIRAHVYLNGVQQMVSAGEYEDEILTPNPNPDFLTKDFCLQPGLERIFLLRRTWSGQKLLPLQFP